MCNDVRKILSFLDRGNTKELNIAPQQKEKLYVEDDQELMMKFYDECLALYKRCESQQEFENNVNDIIDQYNTMSKSNFDYSILKNGLWEQFHLL